MNALTDWSHTSRGDLAYRAITPIPKGEVMTEEQTLLMFRMKFDLLMARHDTRCDVASKQYVDEMQQLYGAYRDYLREGNIDKAIERGIL